MMAHTPAELKAVMEREQLNFRSFADDGSIGRSWNSPQSPSFYVLDRNGIIRHKWIGHPGEKTIDTVLNKLIAEVK